MFIIYHSVCFKISKVSLYTALSIVLCLYNGSCVGGQTGLVMEAGSGGGQWRRAVEAGSGGGQWRRAVEAGSGGGQWRRAVEAGSGGGQWRHVSCN